MNTSFVIRPDAVELLEENYNGSDKSLDFAEWTLDQAKTDPSFYSWLFPSADNINDFGSGMSIYQVETADKFIQSIEILQDVKDNYEDY